MNRICAHVIKLTRSIAFTPYAAEQRPSVQFFAGRPSPFMFARGFALSWFYNADAYRAIAAISSLILETDSEFKDCDLNSVKGIVSNTLQEICLDSPLFNGNDVAFGGRLNLFECRGSVTVSEFATTILDEIKLRLRGSIGLRCMIYPLTRFTGPSFSIPDLGLYAVTRADVAGWECLEDKGYLFNGWSPQSPILQPRGSHFPIALDFSYTLVSEKSGSQKGTKFSSILELRALIAIMFAVASQQSTYPYHKAMAQQNTQCLQFPHDTCPDQHFFQSDCGALAPFYASDVPLNDASVLEILSWYKSLSLCSSEFKQRIEKAVYFVNRGMNSDDIEAYINYFVALDALFGERGSVEASIARGINRLGLGSVIEKQASQLFDLRNELVHGGSRFIAEWSKYYRYTAHFKTEPLDDLKRLVLNAVIKAPSLSD